MHTLLVTTIAIYIFTNKGFFTKVTISNLRIIIRQCRFAKPEDQDFLNMSGHFLVISYNRISKGNNYKSLEYV